MFGGIKKNLHSFINHDEYTRSWLEENKYVIRKVCIAITRLQSLVLKSLKFFMDVEAENVVSVITMSNRDSCGWCVLHTN